MKKGIHGRGVGVGGAGSMGVCLWGVGGGFWIMAGFAFGMHRGGSCRAVESAVWKKHTWGLSRKNIS